MSKVEFRNQKNRAVTHTQTGRTGDLRVHDRVTTRGSDTNVSKSMAFEAIFTFDDPVICAKTNVPDHGGYFMRDDGNAEVTQLIARFPSDEDRLRWITTLFGG